ncbi:MAG: efflux RND transporter periplasmic adaptor subunit [Candidatus Abyssobacteria bacterium SURF_5]|uniref:Efflux RND transporter periplasmic adaptor subunit n=1 Tax=Abyssobacteria bacterium (strain SURF_5) TaxID=2093360 RepID=A0A3A4NPE3_ABYX5|nr:MAG: efflux RND transporter periplasmic adaptor subunit [Candidatus Abyssubacteria bacterium SURF_5]
MQMFKKQLIPGIVIIFLIALVAALFLLPGATRSIEQPPEERVADVRVMELNPDDLLDVIDLPATVEPFVSTEVPAEVSGRIDWIGPAEGSIISKGAPIIRIDQRTYQAELNEARASYDLAMNNHKRMQRLYEEGIVSKDKMDEFKTSVATSVARLDMAKVQLEKASINSPIAGVLNDVYFDVGEYVRQGDKVAEIVVIDPVKVLVRIPEKDIPYIKKDERVDVVFKMNGLEDRRGTINYLSVVGNAATRTYDVEITVPNPSHEILPSMIARVRVVKQHIPNAITVPLFSVIPRGDYKAVFVENDGRAEERQVELGILAGNSVQILSGLQPHERLIVEGHRELTDGEKIRVVGVAEEVS